MFVNPSAKVNVAYANQFCNQESVYSEGSATTQSSAKKKLETAQQNYLTRILSGQLSKGTRPWEVVNITEGMDPSTPWIGIEWETGFCTRKQYQATIQWMWENHHNWAVDNEGIGPYRGEFTFPPVELERFVAGDTMMDSMRAFMKSKRIVTPTKYQQIDQYKTNTTTSDPRDRWGCHVNISIPETRNSYDATSALSMLMAHIFTETLHTAPNELLTTVFNRRPYGWGGHRAGNDGTNWMEWKLFKTPATNAEVEKIRTVTARLTELMRDVATNPRKYVVSEQKQGSYANVTTMMLPSAKSLAAWLRGETDELILEETKRTVSWKWETYIKALTPKTKSKLN